MKIGEEQHEARAIGAALVASLPALARAETQVPAIQANATASASATLRRGRPTIRPELRRRAAAPVPVTMPPPISLVSPAVAPLNSKERAGSGAFAPLGKPQRNAARRRRWICPLPVRGNPPHSRLRTAPGLQPRTPARRDRQQRQPGRQRPVENHAVDFGKRAGPRPRTSSSSPQMPGSCRHWISKRTGAPTP